MSLTVATVTGSVAVQVLALALMMTAEQVRPVSGHDVEETWKQASCEANAS